MTYMPANLCSKANILSHSRNHFYQAVFCLRIQARDISQKQFEDRSEKKSTDDS